MKIFGPNEEGIFTAIYSVAMRVRPKVSIHPSVASQYKLEMLSVTQAAVQFKIKHAKGGHLVRDPKEVPPFICDSRF